MSTPSVFISYSQKDESWKNLLFIQLKALVQQGDITLWDDSKIGTGQSRVLTTGGEEGRSGCLPSCPTLNQIGVVSQDGVRISSKLVSQKMLLVS